MQKHPDKVLIFICLLALLSFLVVIFQNIGCTDYLTKNSGSGIKPVQNKNSVIQMANHSGDTLITLERSQKTLLLDKNIPQDKLLLLDEYLTSGQDSIKNKNIEPDSLPKVFQKISCLEVGNYFKQVQGKYLGIWINPHVVLWSKCHNQYGFTNILSDFSSAVYAVASGFRHDSLMIGPLGHTTSWKDIYDGNNPAYNFYFVDEPFEHMSIAEFSKISRLIYLKSPGAKLLFADYYWPDVNLLCYFTSGNKHSILNYYFASQNAYIMCDQYDGNWCGDVRSFWNAYKSSYGVPKRNFSNWVTLDSENSSDWKDLFYLAASMGMNTLWIYGLDKNVNKSRLVDFCTTAWKSGWLFRKGRHLDIIYQCSDIECHWPDKGNWKVQSVHFDAQKFFKFGK